MVRALVDLDAIPYLLVDLRPPPNTSTTPPLTVPALHVPLNQLSRALTGYEETSGSSSPGLGGGAPPFPPPPSAWAAAGLPWPRSERANLLLVFLTDQQAEAARAIEMAGRIGYIKCALVTGGTRMLHVGATTSPRPRASPCLPSAASRPSPPPHWV